MGKGKGKGKGKENHFSEESRILLLTSLNCDIKKRF